MKRSADSKPSEIVVAKIGKTIGLDGKLKLHLLSDFPEQFKKGSKFFCEGEELIVDSFDPSALTVRFRGYSGVDSASRLTNKTISTTFEATRESCRLKEGEFFWFDVVGLMVYEAGELLGSVESIERYGATDYLSIKTADALVADGMPKSFLLPYQDRFVEKISLEDRSIYAQNAKDILSES